MERLHMENSFFRAFFCNLTVVGKCFLTLFFLYYYVSFANSKEDASHCCGDWLIDEKCPALFQENAAISHGLKQVKSIDVGFGQRIDFMLIPPGRFIMGPSMPSTVNPTRFWMSLFLLISSSFFIFLIGFWYAIEIKNKKHGYFYSLRSCTVLFIIFSFFVGGCVGMYGHYIESCKYEYELEEFRIAKSASGVPHEIKIRRPFYMSKTEVTYGQWLAIESMVSEVDLRKYSREWRDVFASLRGGEMPESMLDPNLPVEGVSWEFCQALSNKLSACFGLHFRLPTEAEWEYACRSGSRGKYSFGDNAELLPLFSVYEKTYAKGTGLWPRPVASKRPNAWGLYDMHGNVMEWCNDCFYDNAYDLHDQEGRLPGTPSDWTGKVVRGGWYLSNASSCTSVERAEFQQNAYDILGIGCRLVIECE